MGKHNLLLRVGAYSDAVRVELLDDYPELVSVVAGWVQQYWSEVITFQRAYEKLVETLDTKGIPFTIVSLLDDMPIGTASVFVNDMASKPSLTPWLTDVYVLPEYRGLGIGKRLVKEALRMSQSLGYDDVYLWCDEQESYYSCLGWGVFERTTHRDKPAVIMRYCFHAQDER